MAEFVIKRTPHDVDANEPWIDIDVEPPPEGVAVTVLSPYGEMRGVRRGNIIEVGIPRSWPSRRVTHWKPREETETIASLEARIAALEQEREGDLRVIARLTFRLESLETEQRGVATDEKTIADIIGRHDSELDQVDEQGGGLVD